MKDRHSVGSHAKFWKVLKAKMLTELEACGISTGISVAILLKAINQIGSCMIRMNSIAILKDVMLFLIHTFSCDSCQALSWDSFGYRVARRHVL
jgi:hypothetical protein